MLLDFPAFRPHPLVRGGHLQTIVGSYLPTRVAVDSTLHRVELPDGDAIALHDDGALVGSKTASGYRRIHNGDTHDGKLLASRCGEPVAILIHGLGGCNRSGYMLRCSAKLRACGVRVFRMDLRGCGAGMSFARHPLHAGRSEDAAAVLDYVAQQCPGSPIHLAGFSMGANIVLKMAGELGDEAPPNLASVMAVSPPIDLVACTRNIQRGLNCLYDRRFVRSLVRHIRRRTALVPDALSAPLIPRPRRLKDFDSLFTAPLAGFANVDDYYTRASSGSLLARIAVPTLILTAASDPIVPVQPFELASYSPTTQLEIAPCGGHLGFVAAQGIDTDIRWLDWRVVQWITSQTALWSIDSKRRGRLNRDRQPARSFVD
jgi:predicted alpha/beta-fold hydrolase